MAYTIKPGADLRNANLRDVDLKDADLRNADLAEADLRDADLRGVNFWSANLWCADLRGADLRKANFQKANLWNADLRGANLDGTFLEDANLREADLSGAVGIETSKEFLEQFRQTENGLVVYKDVKSPNFFKPKHWVIAPGEYLTDNCDMNKTTQCGCGVAFATLDWLIKHSSSEIWECEIEWMDLADVCVPYNTDGKARCARLRIVKKYRDD